VRSGKRRKKMTNKTAMRRFAFCAVPLVFVSSLVAAPVRAQGTTAPAKTQSQAQTQASYSEAQIEQFVAPIALYPDSLLTQILMASTYPLEVVEAARWSHDNPAVTGTALQDAMQAQSWDASVKALTAVPQTLAMMSDKLDWTQQLGDAFLAQQQDVLNAVQKLRAQAQAAGNLQSTPQQVVTTAPVPAGVVSSAAQRPIVIEPVDPNVYYVPVYNPAVVYGGWDYPTYPPFYWSPPGFVASNIVSFAAGVAVGSAIWGGCNWWNHSLIINVNRYNIYNHTNINITNNTWIHNPAHRHGVPYPNANVAKRFDRGNEAAARNSFRDRTRFPHEDVFRDRTNDDHGGVLSDHARTEREDNNFRRTEADTREAVRRNAPTLPERRGGEYRGAGGDRAMDRATPEHREFAPRNNARWHFMRPRAQTFRSEGHAMGGEFHGRGGGRRL
jgi:hypothetical protein